MGVLRVVLIALGVLGGLAMLAGLIIFLSTRAIVRKSDEFITAVQAGQSDAAYSHFSDAAKQATAFDAFSTFIRRVSPILAGQTRTVLTRETNAGETR